MTIRVTGDGSLSGVSSVTDTSGGGLTFDGSGGVSASSLVVSSLRASVVRHPSSGVDNIRLAADGTVEVYDGSEWVALGASGGGFNASVTITATDASWTVPTLADPVVKVTVVAGGGGGSNSDGGVSKTFAGNGTNSSFSCSAGTITATGGRGAVIIGNSTSEAGFDARNGMISSNGGGAGMAKGGNYVTETGVAGEGGGISVGYVNLTDISTASITVGAGGLGSTAGEDGGDGGNGVVIVEYRAG